MHENVVEIPLDDNGKHFAIVDEADFHLFVGRAWCLSLNGYAIASDEANVSMHRVILGLSAGDGMDADHIDRDRLNNRRANLRACSRSENCCNKAKPRGWTNPYKGVSFNKKRNYWHAQVKLRGKNHFVGAFTTALEAAVARDEYAAKLHGAFFRPSVPNITGVVPKRLQQRKIAVSEVRQPSIRINLLGN